jgi:hypothetical protein
VQFTSVTPPTNDIECQSQSSSHTSEEDQESLHSQSSSQSNCQDDKDDASALHETASAADQEEVLGDALKDHLLWASEVNREI